MKIKILLFLSLFSLLYSTSFVFPQTGYNSVSASVPYQSNLDTFLERVKQSKQNMTDAQYEARLNRFQSLLEPLEQKYNGNTSIISIINYLQNGITQIQNEFNQTKQSDEISNFFRNFLGAIDSVEPVQPIQNPQSTSVCSYTPEVNGEPVFVLNENFISISRRQPGELGGANEYIKVSDGNIRIPDQERTVYIYIDPRFLGKNIYNSFQIIANRLHGSSEPVIKITDMINNEIIYHKAGTESKLIHVKVSSNKLDFKEIKRFTDIFLKPGRIYKIETYERIFTSNLPIGFNTTTNWIVYDGIYNGKPVKEVSIGRSNIRNNITGNSISLEERANYDARHFDISGEYEPIEGFDENGNCIGFNPEIILNSLQQ